MVKIKVSSVSNLTDARYFAAKEASWLGFSFERDSAHYISPASMLAIREWVDGVSFMGEFNFASAEDLQHAANNYRLDGLQVGMFTPSEVLEALNGQTTVFREIVVLPDMDIDALRSEISRTAHLTAASVLSFLPNRLTWHQIQSGLPLNIADLHELCNEFSIFLDIHWDALSLETALSQVNPYGIILRGGQEEKTGVKSFDDLEALFDILEQA
jgi:phosphoribosylanthranilate isomerase